MSVEKNTSNPKLEFLLPISLSVACSMSVMAFQNVHSPFIDTIAQSWKLSYLQTNILVAAPTFLTLILVISFGRLLDRINPVQFSVWPLSILFVLSVIGLLARDYWSLFATRLLSGIAFAPLFIISTQITQLMYPKELKNRMTTIQTLGPPTAILFVMLIGPSIGARFDFPGVYILPMCFSAIGIIVSLSIWNRSFERQRQCERSKTSLSIETKMLAVAWGFFNIVTTTFVTMGTNIGIDLSFERQIAIFGPIMQMIPSYISSPIAGEIMDKRISRLKLIIIGSIVMALSLSILYTTQTMWVIGWILLGFSAALIPPVIFTSPSRFEKPESIGRAVSTFTFAGMAGMFVAPPIVGLLKDITHSWSGPMSFAAVMSLCIITCTISIRRSLS